MSNAHFDVIIVGGRPAGAGLAARLGAAGLNVLVVDKATFPSRPQVPSNPVIYVAAMDLLDEIGVAEAEYAPGAVRVDAFQLHVLNYFDATMNVGQALANSDLSRRYAYSIERRVLDAALWNNLGRFPTVTRREDFSVTSLLRDAQGKVTGIEGRVGKQAPETFTADLVVGADGRFSFVATQVGAQSLHEHTQYRSAAYFADWENVQWPSDSLNTVHIFTTMRGKNYMFFPLPEGRTTVVLYIQPELVTTETSLQDFYLSELQACGPVWACLSAAEQKTKLLGMKPITNGYRETYGDGWVLVGDALHYKDPADGQGIYDALLESKLLAEAIVRWKCEQQPWDVAVKGYQTGMMAETKPMFDETLARIKRELYDSPPPFIIRTLMRWMLTNPAYHEQFMRYLSRDISPTNWLKPSLMGKVVREGLVRDVTGRIRPAN